jgi:hypothetical protein
MNILKAINDAIYYLSEGAAILFSPSHDNYPSIGVQPYSDDPYSEWMSLSSHEIK